MREEGAAPRQPVVAWRQLSLLMLPGTVGCGRVSTDWV